MIVVNVLYNPALTPLGGSLVTLTALCSNPNGKLLLDSQVIQSLNSSCHYIARSGSASVGIIVSNFIIINMIIFIILY
jgi:hypothetical protein